MNTENKQTKNEEGARLSETEQTFEIGSWYGIAWLPKINLDEYYSFRIQRYMGSTHGYTTLVKFSFIRGWQMKELVEEYLNKEIIEQSDIYISFRLLPIKDLLQERISKNVKEWLEGWFGTLEDNEDEAMTKSLLKEINTVFTKHSIL